ncbi:MAG: hypothetical protein ACTHPS_21470, partial [Streptosporangiaceae bacterium]
MGIPDGAHTHGSSGSGLGMAVLVVLGAALAVRLAGPVLAAAEVVYVLGIVVAVTVGGAAVALMVALASRWRRRRLDAARAEVPAAHLPLRAAQPLPHLRHAIERPREVHLHL